MRTSNNELRSFSENIDDFKQTGQYTVDARQFFPACNRGWVCHCDLLGFSSICLKSMPGAINALVRFHKVISHATEQASGDVFRFTDCCFFCSQNLLQTLNFALATIRGCCAMNQICMDSKKLVQGHYLLKPRTTIAFGEYLSGNQMNRLKIQSSVSWDSFLAGAGIVEAYKLQEHSFSHALTLKAPSDAPNWCKQIAVKGMPGMARVGLVRWLEEFGNSNRIDIPWPYIARVKLTKFGILEVVPECNATFLETERHLYSTFRIMESEFLNTDTPIHASKHVMALFRFVMSLYSHSQNSTRIRRDMMEEFLRTIQAYNG